MNAPENPSVTAEPTTTLSEPLVRYRLEPGSLYATVDEVLPPEHFGPPGEGRPGRDGGLRRFGTIGLVLFFIFGKLKYLGLLLQVGKFKTIVKRLRSANLVAAV